MKNNLPTIIISGASGFIGKYFLKSYRNNFYVYAIARRSIIEADVPIHSNIEWIQWDISNSNMLNEIKEHLSQQQSIDFVLHLAGFYDFDYDDKPEYYKTNVVGTKNVLELARFLRVKRFIFASSLAACSFPGKNKAINEKSKADANFAYARTKSIGEEMLKEYSRYFNCTIVRFAAIYSDWCEYAPLYKFLTTWISNRWDSRILAGKGNSAISYLHINDLISIITRIIEKNRFLPSIDTYIASPDGSTSHKDLYKNSTKDYYGKRIYSLYIPKIIAYLGLIGKTVLWKTGITKKPFERLWMMKYIDVKLNVDASYTRKTLAWEPTPRYHIMRRLLYLLVNLKSHSIEWKIKNLATLNRITQRSNLLIYDKLMISKEKVINEIYDFIFKTDNLNKFERTRLLKHTEIKSLINTFYNLILASIRSGDRSLIVKYIRDIAIDKYLAAFKSKELCDIFQIMKESIKVDLQKEKTLKKFKHDINNHIDLGILLAQDGIEDVFLEMGQKLPQEKILISTSDDITEKRDKLILKLSKPYQTIPDAEENKDTKISF